MVRSAQSPEETRTDPGEPASCAEGWFPKIERSQLTTVTISNLSFLFLQLFFAFLGRKLRQEKPFRKKQHVPQLSISVKQSATPPCYPRRHPSHSNGQDGNPTPSTLRAQ